jgi:hypothetical protein
VIIDLPLETSDDPTFLLAVSAITAAVIHDEGSAEVRVIRIANWFDHKWLDFSGKGRVPFDSPFPSHPGVALDAMSQTHTTFPPFTPSRVLDQRRYRRVAPDGGVRDDDARPVHPPAKARSARNLNRRVAAEIPDGAFVWFSSNSAANQRGSVMTYVSHGDHVTRWYASFLGRRGWRVGRVKGISREAVESFVTNGAHTGAR